MPDNNDFENIFGDDTAFQQELGQSRVKVDSKPGNFNDDEAELVEVTDIGNDSRFKEDDSISNKQFRNIKFLLWALENVFDMSILWFMPYVNQDEIDRYKSFDARKMKKTDEIVVTLAEITSPTSYVNSPFIRLLIILVLAFATKSFFVSRAAKRKEKKKDKKSTAKVL